MPTLEMIVKTWVL